MRRCGTCGNSIVSRRSDAAFCSGACRVAAHRNSARLPREMTERDRWVRFDSKKRPLQTDGRLASSTDSSTWASYLDATRSTAGIGIGYVLGDGIGCIDLDHCLNARTPTRPAQALIERYPDHYIEVSPSGNGLHIWGTAAPALGTKRTIDGLSIETYSTGRYITVTHNVFQRGTLLPL